MYNLPSIAKALLGIFWNSYCIHRCPHITLLSEWIMSMLAVRVFVGSSLTISFGLASGDYTFDMSAFMLVAVDCIALSY